MYIFTTLTLPVSIGQYFHNYFNKCHDNQYRRKFSLPKYRYCDIIINIVKIRLVNLKYGTAQRQLDTRMRATA